LINTPKTITVARVITIKTKCAFKKDINLNVAPIIGFVNLPFFGYDFYMMGGNEGRSEFEEPENKKDDVMHVHFLHRHVPAAFSYAILVLVAVFIGASVYIYSHAENSTDVIIQNSDGDRTEFVYGSWPALQNAEFFKKTKEDFISKGASFIEADLSAMTIRFFRNGELLKEAPIQTKGRDDSWWETPAGLYKISSKEENHFSSFGRVWMPYSMQFQGNFFIHGPTRYSDGSPTPATYSGGCIRVGLDDVEEIYRLAEIGTPVLVFEQSFNGGKEPLKYKNRNLLPDNVVYLAADLENNFVFAENKSREKHSIASITKLMTALIAVEYINVEREVAINTSMLVKTSISRLSSGDRVAILDLLSLLLMESSNEAALAIDDPLGEDQFVRLMNTKSLAIGMKNSSFVDTSGVSSANVSTAEDLFNLAKYLFYNRSFVLRMSIGEENRAAYGTPRYRNLQNLNLISGVSDMIGGKTGLSSSAGDSMFAVFETEIDGKKRPIAVIVLGSSDAKNDIRSLLEYIKNNFSSESATSI
jgi:serine-type D-Ala-D-Ala carboxypeptidase (penicillin-binding protein 5/6)